MNSHTSRKYVNNVDTFLQYLMGCHDVNIQYVTIYSLPELSTQANNHNLVIQELRKKTEGSEVREESVLNKASTNKIRMINPISQPSDAL